MRVAEVLSDLTSLRVCDPTAAQSLVSARPSPPSSSTEAVKAKTAAALQKGKSVQEDTDLQRAKDLIDLHYKVKVAHENGRADEGLEGARRDVRAVLRGLGL
ncbi:hypothetical protein EJ08DRAFT_691562 [Tothia fuscella]|uniref:Uncharacterized protein n=1 Tax=Tothia fuscella TaxID=1048955 RepID=A0A9P4P1B0_9PEZI|nr:hypothetical protein EJ08DRAFT_691562 [Tothia fuscella]